MPLVDRRLLATLVLLFASRDRRFCGSRCDRAARSADSLIQVLFNSALAYGLYRALGEQHAVACPSALIGASNFFELAVAAAISLFGFNRVPRWRRCRRADRSAGMLLVVRVVNASSPGNEAAAHTQASRSASFIPFVTRVRICPRPR